MACYRDLPNSLRLRYETLSWANYRTLLGLFGNDTSAYVMASLRQSDKLDEYVAYQLATGRYSGKHGTIDWFLKRDEAYIGVLHLYDINYEIWDGKRSPCMVGYAIAEPFRRQGYAEEALQHLLDRLPTDFLLFEAQAEPLAVNEVSRRLLEKTGFLFRRNFMNYWGQAALYHRQLVPTIPEVTFDELDKLM